MGTMTEERLRGIEATWKLFLDDNRDTVQGTPPALVAMAQVKELVAEVRRLHRELAAAVAMNLCHVPVGYTLEPSGRTEPTTPPPGCGTVPRVKP